MATMKANGGVVVFVATKPAKRRYCLDHEHRLMGNGAALRPRGGGGFKKVRTVLASRGLTFEQIADEYLAEGWAVNWERPAMLHDQPKVIKRRPRILAKPARRPWVVRDRDWQG